MRLTAAAALALGLALRLRAHAVSVTYDLGSYGELVTGLEFETQAG